MPKKISIVVVILFVLLYMLPLGIRPMIIPDESRYAEIPREMIASGDWVVPHLNGLRYFEKPVMGYWLHALSLLLFGENAFGVRFPSALAAGISGMTVFVLTRYMLGYSSGMPAAVIFLTCLEVFALGVFSVLDGILSMFITGAMTLFFMAYSETLILRKNILLALFGLLCGFAFLTKGFLAFAVPVITVVPFMIWEGRFKEVFLKGFPKI